MPPFICNCNNIASVVASAWQNELHTSDRFGMVGCSMLDESLSHFRVTIK